jgi:hypothetical protein
MAHAQEALMPALFEMVQRIDQVIAVKGLEKFKTKGQIALKVGYALSGITRETPDDPVRVHRLADAAKDVLGQPV